MARDAFTRALLRTEYLNELMKHAQITPIETPLLAFARKQINAAIKEVNDAEGEIVAGPVLNLRMKSSDE